MKRTQQGEGFLSKLRAIMESAADSSFINHDSISVFIQMKDDAVIYYFHGHTYKSKDGRFLRSMGKVPPMSSLKQIFDSCFEEQPHMEFEDFIEEYRDMMANSKLVLTTYTTAAEYCKIIESGVCRRLIRESSAVSLYLSSFHTPEDDGESTHIISYGESIYTFTYGDRVCEIGMDADSIEELENAGTNIGRKHQITTSRNLMYAVLGGLTLSAQTLMGDDSMNILLLDTFPFDIYFGPKWGKTIPKMIERGLTNPIMISDRFDFAATDYIGIKIGDRVYEFDLTKKLGTIPKEIECTVETDADNKLKFTIHNPQTHETQTFTLPDLKFTT